ncbi:hypothetical protein Holit_03268 [Hollandina sp. SP2]
MDPVAFRFGIQCFIIGNQHPAIAIASQGLGWKKRKDPKIADGPCVFIGSVIPAFHAECFRRVFQYGKPVFSRQSHTPVHIRGLQEKMHRQYSCGVFGDPVFRVSHIHAESVFVHIAKHRFAAQTGNAGCGSKEGKNRGYHFGAVPEIQDIRGNHQGIASIGNAYCVFRAGINLNSFFKFSNLLPQNKSAGGNHRSYGSVKFLLIRRVFPGGIVKGYVHVSNSPVISTVEKSQGSSTGFPVFWDL